MKQAGRRMVLAGALALAGLGGAPLAAQDAAGVIGNWTGTIEEGGMYYDIFVWVDLDRDGRPVGNVAYSQPCNGVWAEGARQGRGWRFEETITDGRDLCAAHVDVMAEPDGDELAVRLRPVGIDGAEATGTLYRIDDAYALDAAQATEDAADAAEGEYLSAIAWCNPGETGIEYGQAAGETWFIDNDPIRVNGRRYVKYGLPRLIPHGDVSSYSIYGDAGVAVEAGSDELQPEVIYVLVRAPDSEGACEYQPYQGE